MCVQCAMAAAAGATGVRAWLQNHAFIWLTPGRLRAITIALGVAALLVPSVVLSGSSKAQHEAPKPPPAAHAQR